MNFRNQSSAEVGLRLSDTACFERLIGHGGRKLALITNRWWALPHGGDARAPTASPPWSGRLLASADGGGRCAPRCRRAPHPTAKRVFSSHCTSTQDCERLAPRRSARTMPPQYQFSGAVIVRVQKCDRHLERISQPTCDLVPRYVFACFVLADACACRELVDPRAHRQRLLGERRQFSSLTKSQTEHRRRCYRW